MATSGGTSTDASRLEEGITRSGDVATEPLKATAARAIEGSESLSVISLRKQRRTRCEAGCEERDGTAAGEK